MAMVLWADVLLGYPPFWTLGILRSKQRSFQKFWVERSIFVLLWVARIPFRSIYLEYWCLSTNPSDFWSARRKWCLWVADHRNEDRGWEALDYQWHKEMDHEWNVSSIFLWYLRGHLTTPLSKVCGLVSTRSAVVLLYFSVKHSWSSFTVGCKTEVRRHGLDVAWDGCLLSLCRMVSLSSLLNAGRA